MKIRDGRIIRSNKTEERVFRGKLKRILKKYLNLYLSDIPEFIEKLREKSKEYQLEYESEDDISFKFRVKANEKESFIVKILKTTEAYQICKVIKDGKEVDIYSVRKGIQLNEF